MTYDLLLGGTSTASAKFAFMNIDNGATPVASISAPSGTTLILNGNGSIATNSKNTLTIGGGDSGEVYTASLLHLDSTYGIRGGGLSDCDNPATAKLLWDSTTNRFSCGTDQGGGGGSSITVRESDSSPAVSAVAVLEFGPGTTSSDEFIVTDEGSSIARVRIGNQVGMLNQAETVTGGWTFDTAATTFTTAINANGGLTTATDTNLALTAAGIGNVVFTIDPDTGVLIGSDSNTPAPLSISGGIGNNAALIVNQQNSGNLFAASASGITKFVIDSDGSILFAGGSLSDSSDGVDIADDLDVSGAINLSTGNLAFSSTGNIVMAGGNISDSAGSVVVNDNLSVAGTTGITFTSTGGVVLASGTISDSAGAVTIDDDVSVSGSTGLTFTDSAAAVIFGNSERIVNSTNGTLTFGRNDAGTVTLTAADDDTTAALTITSGGAAALTLDTGGAATLSIGDTNASAIVIGKSTNGQSVTINTGTGGLNIGDTANTKAIEIGGVDTDGGDTIRISTNATSPDSINIGNSNAGTTMALTGGDDWSITTAGTATFTKVAGAGLSDCDTATSSKLLWDSTNQTFSCGTDNAFPQSKTFSDTTSNTSVSWTVAANVWDGTQPNITITNTSNRVLVSFTANIVTDDAADEQAALQIRRAIGGTATCTDTAVGEALLGTFLTTASQEQSLSGTFLDTGSFTASDVANYTICTDGHANSLDDGTVLSLTMTLVEVGPAGADLAEVYYAEESIVPGEVVSLDPLRSAGVMKSTRAYDSNVLGIVSTQPGLVLGTSENHPGRPVLVALSGRVPVKVSTENGAILPGDLLTSSSIPGIAMKATKPGVVIGQAMTAYGDSEIGSVMVFIKNQWYDPDGTLVALDNFTLHQRATESAEVDLITNAGETVTRVGAFAEVAVGNIRAGYLDVQENITAGMIAVRHLTTDSLAVTTENITIGGVTLREYLAGIVREVLNEQSQEGTNGTGLIAEQATADLISKLLDEKVLGASSSASLTLSSFDQTTQESVATPSAQEEQEQDSIADASSVSLQGLQVEGLATISANLRVKNNTLVEGVLTVIDTLMTKNLIVSGLATFFDEVVFKGDVIFAKHPTFSKDTAGFAVIKKGNNAVEIVFDNEYEQTPVVNASISLEEITSANPMSNSDEERQKEIEEAILGSRVSYIVSDRTQKGFRILLSEPAKDDVTFSWTAFAIDEPITYESKGDRPLLTPTPAGESLLLSTPPIQAREEVSE